MLLSRENKEVQHSKFKLYVRSIIFALFSLSIITFFGLFSLFLFLFPLETRYKVIYFYIDFYFLVLKSICKLDYQITGLENIPKDRAGIVFAKHSSTFETFVLPRYFPLIAPIAKHELAWVPFFGWGLSAVHPILINRSDKKSAMQQIIEKGKKFLAAGRWILFFPEGTRVPYGTVGNYKLGGARLAVATGAPILPVAHNAGKYWPRRKLIKYPGTIKIVIGEVIESKDQTPEELLERAKVWIEDTIAKM